MHLSIRCTSLAPNSQLANDSKSLAILYFTVHFTSPALDTCQSCHQYTTCLHSIASASLSLPQSPLPALWNEGGLVSTMLSIHSLSVFSSPCVTFCTSVGELSITPRNQQRDWLISVYRGRNNYDILVQHDWTLIISMTHIYDILSSL